MNEKTQSVILGILSFVIIVAAFVIGMAYFNRDADDGIHIRRDKDRIEIEVDRDEVPPVNDGEYRIRVWPFVDIQGDNR